MGKVQRLRPLKPRVVGWCRHYAGRGVRVSYLADLFMALDCWKLGTGE